MSMPAGRRIWLRKRGSGPALESGLAGGRCAAVHGLDAAAAVPAAARELGAGGSAGRGANHRNQRQTGAIRCDRSADRPSHRADPPPCQAGRRAGVPRRAAPAVPPRRPIWLLADRASAHTAPQTLAVATQLRIRFLWLPKQAPELSPMDQLWRELKRLIAANRQAESIDALAADAAAWLLTLTPQQARRKAAMTSSRFWLKSLLQHFWLPT
jgi:transposase